MNISVADPGFDLIGGCGLLYGGGGGRKSFKVLTVKEKTFCSVFGKKLAFWA